MGSVGSYRLDAKGGTVRPSVPAPPTTRTGTRLTSTHLDRAFTPGRVSHAEQASDRATACRSTAAEDLPPRSI